jgi:hypothetical protein
MAKSAEAEKAGTTQHSPKQRSQSARRLARRSGDGAADADADADADSSATGMGLLLICEH